MKAFSLEASPKTPEVFFNPKKNTLLIYGRSLPEHPLNFYNEIYGWLQTYFNENPDGTMEMVVMFEYCNTTSSKVILDMFTRLGKILPHKNSCSLKWHYEVDDPDMRDIAEIIFAEKLINGEIIGVNKLDPSPFRQA